MPVGGGEAASTGTCRPSRPIPVLDGAALLNAELPAARGLLGRTPPAAACTGYSVAGTPSGWSVLQATPRRGGAPYPSGKR